MRRLPPALLVATIPLAAGLLASTACSRRMVVHTSYPKPLVAPGPNTLLPGTFLDTPGHWSFYESDWGVELTVTASDTSLGWELLSQEAAPGGGRSNGVGTGGFNLPAAGAAWFVYVESPRKLWFFNSRDELYYQFRDDSGSRGAPAISGGQLQEPHPPVPAELVARLPEDLRKLLPAAPPPVGKPSF